MSCLIQSDPLAGLFGATAFTLVATYAAVFHTTRWLAITWLATAATLAVLAVRLGATDVAFAVSAALLVAFIVVFVSFTGRATISLVDADILHENFEPLTGLFNRDGFYEKAITLLASRSRGDDRYLAVAVINLDSFSLVGEFSGMSGVSRARVEIAQRLRETARRDAVIAHIADSRIRDRRPFRECGRVRAHRARAWHHHRLTVSPVGQHRRGHHPLAATGAAPPNDVLDELLSIATNAMYASRKGGGNQVTYVRNPALTVLDDPGNDEWFDTEEPA